jgi:predicted O-methyltransferase YrrM
VPGSWGFSMAGCEATIRMAVAGALGATTGVARYLEIGVARGDTFARICEELADGGRPWEAIALDLPEGIEEAEGYARAASCLDLDAFDANVAPWADHVQLFLFDSQKWLARPHLPTPFSLALIDGCHERECTAADFRLLAPHVVPGGVVIFHDTAPWSQDDPDQVQPHRGQPLQVRAALEDLGLLAGTFPGWRFLSEADGRREMGGRGCIVYQKSLA